jgi:hypothetical protein
VNGPGMRAKWGLNSAWRVCAQEVHALLRTPVMQCPVVRKGGGNPEHPATIVPELGICGKGLSCRCTDLQSAEAVDWSLDPSREHR